MNKIVIPFLVFCYFLIATTYITYPLIFHLKDYSLGYGDQLLIAWIMNWDIHSFFHNIFSIFNANIYYPYHNSLAFSDTFFSSALIAIIPLLFLKEPIVAYNINFIIALITLGFFTYLLVRYLTFNDWAGIISGTLVAFSNFTLSRFMHLQVITMQWVPLSLLFFFIYMKTKKSRYFVLTCIFFIVQTANSFLPGYFLIFSYAAILIYCFFIQRKVFLLFLSKKVLITTIITLLAILPLGIPYLQVSHEFNYVRDIRDTIRFANRLDYTFYPSDRTRLGTFLLQTFYKNDTSQLIYDGYLGFVIIVLSLFVLLFRFLVYRKENTYYLDAFLFIGIGAFILSFGPAFQWGEHIIKKPFIIPLPYVVFYYLVPGFKGFRNSARWEMLTVFAFSVGIGLFFSYAMEKMKIRTKILITASICFLVLIEFNFPYPLFRIPPISSFPPVYQYINTLPQNAAIIEFPIYNWNFLPYSPQEQVRQYYSTVHFRNMVNGGSGFSPPEWQKNTINLYLHFPDTQTITYLKHIHVDYAVIHPDEYVMLYDNNFRVQGIKPRKWETIQNAIAHTKNLHLVKQVGKDYVYEIL